ncbi:hypothetical protein J6590_104463 [Homalodisca vitripennis]|nr:hypothetical protein J6590_104463 [Homalodisca vitripennis]
MRAGEECLWKVTSKDYHNKVKREAAYTMLVQKVKEIDPLANKTLVTKKINSLRTAFRKELRKTGSLVSGMSADDVYVPKLWYFDQLLFLTDQEVPMMSKSSLSAATDVVADDGDANDDNDDEYVDDVDETNNVSGSITSPALKNHASQLMDNQSVRSQTPPTRPSSTASAASTSRVISNQFKRQKKVEDKVLETVSEKLSQLKREDQFDIFGRNVAAKLRSLPQEQRIYAEKRINDALFDAELHAFQQNSMTIRQNLASHTITTTCQPIYQQPPAYRPQPQMPGNPSLTVNDDANYHQQQRPQQQNLFTDEQNTSNVSNYYSTFMPSDQP